MLNPIMETEASPVFRLNGIYYVPHYSEPVWVQPGAFIKSANKIKKSDDYWEDKSKRLSATELFDRGATLLSQQLWPRPWTKNWERWLKP